MKEKKDIVKSIVVLFVICLVVSAALAVVNSFTAPVSAANATERENEARRAVIPRDLGKVHKMTAEQIQELAQSGLVHAAEVPV